MIRSGIKQKLYSNASIYGILPILGSRLALLPPPSTRASGGQKKRDREDFEHPRVEPYAYKRSSCYNYISLQSLYFSSNCCYIYISLVAVTIFIFIYDLPSSSSSFTLRLFDELFGCLYCWMYALIHFAVSLFLISACMGKMGMTSMSYERARIHIVSCNPPYVLASLLLHNQQSVCILYGTVLSLSLFF